MNNHVVPGAASDVQVNLRGLNLPAVSVQYKTNILKKNIVEGVNTLTQSMMNETNTKYVIKYDYVLGEDITVPENCILEFDGGSLSNGSLVLQNTEIIGGDNNVLCSLEGSVKGDVHIDWVMDGNNINESNATRIENLLLLNNTKFIFTKKAYTVTHLIHLPLSKETIEIDGNDSLITGGYSGYTDANIFMKISSVNNKIHNFALTTFLVGFQIETDALLKNLEFDNIHCDEVECGIYRPIERSTEWDLAIKNSSFKNCERGVLFSHNRIKNLVLSDIYISNLRVNPNIPSGLTNYFDIHSLIGINISCYDIDESYALQNTSIVENITVENVYYPNSSFAVQGFEIYGVSVKFASREGNTILMSNVNIKNYIYENDIHPQDINLNHAIYLSTYDAVLSNCMVYNAFAISEGLLSLKRVERCIIKGCIISAAIDYLNYFTAAERQSIYGVCVETNATVSDCSFYNVPRGILAIGPTLYTDNNIYKCSDTNAVYIDFSYSGKSHYLLVSKGDSIESSYLLRNNRNNSDGKPLDVIFDCCNLSFTTFFAASNAFKNITLRNCVINLLDSSDQNPMSFIGSSVTIQNCSYTYSNSQGGRALITKQTGAERVLIENNVINGRIIALGVSSSAGNTGNQKMMCARNNVVIQGVEAFYINSSYYSDYTSKVALYDNTNNNYTPQNKKGTTEYRPTNPTIGQEYYDTTLGAKIYAKLITNKVQWVYGNGFSALPTRGATTDRPVGRYNTRNGLSLPTGIGKKLYIGYTFHDTTTQKYYIATEISGDTITWTEEDTFAGKTIPSDVTRSGNRSARPNNEYVYNNLYVGFEYQNDGAKIVNYVVSMSRTGSGTTEDPYVYNVEWGDRIWEGLDFNNDIGFCYYDATIHKPIYVNSINRASGVITWVDATGATV